jgi:hypothetical protein
MGSDSNAVYGREFMEYTIGTRNYAILKDFRHKTSSTKLYGASNSTWGTDHRHQRSVSGAAFMLAGGAIYYYTHITPTTTLSSMKDLFHPFPGVNIPQFFMVHHTTGFWTDRIRDTPRPNQDGFPRKLQLQFDHDPVERSKLEKEMNQ